MYKIHLIFKYLRHRFIPWISLFAVMLCTTMVVVVVSIMGGWVHMVEEAGHQVIGDIIVTRADINGFPYYQEMIDQIKSLPEVKAAAPVIQTFGLININDRLQAGVQVVGLDPAQMAPVDGFSGSLYLNADRLNSLADHAQQEGYTPDDAQAMRQKAASFPSFEKPLAVQSYRLAYLQSLAHPVVPRIDVAQWPGMIVGNHVLPHGEDGKLNRGAYLYHLWAQLTVMSSIGRSGAGITDQTKHNYWITDDSTTGLYTVDQSSVYVPFDLLQKDLRMDPQTSVDDAGVTQTEPARCTDIQISLKDGFSPEAVCPKVQKIVDAVIAKEQVTTWFNDPITAQTWKERQGPYLAAIENQKGLLVILFGIISLVAVFMIFCIFYMIVVEKTRDIGIIKSVGATGWGIAQVYLGFSLTIGIIGSASGLLLSYLIVHNINELHAWLGRTFHIVIWDPRSYIFNTIPNTIEPRDAIIIASVGVVFSVVGALLPALRAARLTPVEALRWE